MEEIVGCLKYLSNERLLDIFEKNTIRLTQPLALNDPLEFNPILNGFPPGHHSPFVIHGITMPSHEQITREYLLEKRVNTYGILSLTKNPLSYEMWSRYANGHKGFILELIPDFNKNKGFLTKTSDILEIKKVEYVEKHEVDLNSFIDKEGNIYLEKFDQLTFFKKVKHWEAENEYRLIKLLDELKKHESNPEIYLADLPIELINSVTFGAFMKSEDKKYVIDRCRDKKIQFFQSVIYRDHPEQRMGLWSMDKEAVFSAALKWKPRRFVLDADRIDEHLNKIVLNNITELPYYRSNQAVVEDLFALAKKKTSNT